MMPYSFLFKLGYINLVKVLKNTINIYSNVHVVVLHIQYIYSIYMLILIILDLFIYFLNVKVHVAWLCATIVDLVGVFFQTKLKANFHFSSNCWFTVDHSHNFLSRARANKQQQLFCNIICQSQFFNEVIKSAVITVLFYINAVHIT